MWGLAASVGLAVDCSETLRSLFIQELQDAYPGTNVRVLSESEVESDCVSWSLSLRLQPDVLLLRTYDSFLDETEMRQFADPVAGLLSAMRTGSSGRVRCRVELSIRPAPLWRERSAKQIADGVLTSFKNVFGFDAGSAPRLLHIFRNCLLSLIETPNASIQSVQRLLVDASFRISIIAQVRNEAVREFWLTEFNRWNERDRTQYIASLQNKLGAFTTNQQLQRVLNSNRKGIQLREIMDDSKILICNLSKGTVGHDASTLLGSLLLSSLQIAAMSRASIAETARTDCVVVVDEFHSYMSDGNSTMADALAESRKYRTSYVLSTQMLEQLDPATLAGVLGNCGSTLCMTVGPRDAEVLTELLGNSLSPEDLMRIPKYHAYLRMLINGAPYTFSMTTLPPSRYLPNRGEIIRKVSRERYGR